MAIHIGRREFIATLCGVAAGPLAVSAQQPALPVVGSLNATSLDGYRPMVNAFRQGVRASGYVVGGNVAIEYRWAEGRIDRLPALAAELVHRQVTVIAATTTPAALAAKAATTAIPIVFEIGGDPVALGLAASLSRPGGNITGVTQLTTGLVPKQLEALHFSGRSEQLGELTARRGVPAVYKQREFAAAGGLMSYGTNLVDAYRLAGAYVGRISQG
jgi:putative ABC transport system substrate-binding protein